jgi:PAS domain S-box-containing protein
MKKLIESENKYRVLYNTASDAILIVKNEIFIECNKKTEEIFGCKNEQIIGQTPYRFSPPVQTDGIDSKIKGSAKIKAALAGKPQFFEWQHIKYNGEPFDVEVSINRLDLPSGIHLLAIVRDITQRKLMEVALSKSEERYRKIIEDQTEFIVRWKQGGIRSYVNESYCNYFGITRNEAIGTSFFDLIGENDRKAVLARIAGLSPENPVVIGEHQIIFRDGKSGWNRWTDRAIFDDQGTLLEYQSVGIDITDRKLAEEAARRSEERFKLAAAATKLGTYDWELAINEHIWNDQMYEIFGLKPQSRKDRIVHFINSIHPEDKKRIEEFLASLLSSEIKEKVYQTEYRILVNKQIKHIISRGLTIRDRNGMVQRVIGTCLDITDQKQHEEEIRESEERFRILSESAFEGIAITEKGRFINGNNKLCEILKIDLKELIGMDAINFVAPESRELVETRMKSGFEEPYEHMALTKDGRVFPVEVRGKSIPYRGRIFRVTAIRDITEQKKMQEQLMHAQKMESIGQLAAGVAHDYNNIITAINGFAQLAIVQGNSNPKIMKYLQEIHNAGNRAAKLTSQLLTFSRKQIIQPKIIDVNSVISRMNKMLCTIIGENIKLKLKLSDEINPVKADITQIEQILVNLVINSRDAITDILALRQKNRVLIETKEIYLDNEFVKVHPDSSEGYHVILSVSDTGTGIKKEKLSKIFEPFYTTKAEGKGTGLGLSTVYGIVKQNNGSIYVYSEPGRGTTFNIYWPSARKGEAQKEKILNEKISGGKEGILVVEDDKSVIEFVRSFLSSLGYIVYTANDGEEALQFTKNKPPAFQLLLTDVIMPKMNGKELTDELLKIMPSLKVIFASGYSGEHISRSGILKEGLNFINKPYSMHTLAKTIRYVLDND